MPKIGPHINELPKSGQLVTAHLTFCPRCIKPLQAMAFGPLYWVVVNGVRRAACKLEDRDAVHQQLDLQEEDRVALVPVGSDERVPAAQLCPDCQAEEENNRQLVAAGGLRFRCQVCCTQGVIKSNAWTQALRQQALADGKIQDINEDWGVELTAGCPKCKGEEPDGTKDQPTDQPTPA